MKQAAFGVLTLLVMATASVTMGCGDEERLVLTRRGDGSVGRQALPSSTGKTCEMGDLVDETGETMFQFAHPACWSRHCIAYRGAPGRCTSRCQIDSDCPVGPIDGCSRFVCRIGTPLVGPDRLQCCKFCVCASDGPQEDPALVDVCRKVAMQCPPQ